MSDFLAALSESQRAAAVHDEGPALVLASPGAGKTQVLTARIAHLISQTPRKNFRILALTFTTKAAEEMKVRVDAWLEKGRDRAVTKTFHALCADIIAQHGSHLDLKPDFRILDHDEDRTEVLIEAIADLRNSAGELAAKHRITPEDVKLLPDLERLISAPSFDLEAPSEDPTVEKSRVLANAYLARQRIANRLDFAALLYFANRLLKEQAGVRDLMQTVYRYVCVDEFQDTNAAQYAVLRAIVPADNPNLFCVGDDDQVIYAWNGASLHRITQLGTDYPTLAHFYLPESRRCPPEVVQLANALMRKSKSRAPGKPEVVTMKSGGDAVRMLKADQLADETAEAEAIAKAIEALEPHARGSCAVLARTVLLVQQVHDALIARGIPAHLMRRSSAYATPGLAWLGAILELAGGPGDIGGLRRTSHFWGKLLGDFGAKPGRIHVEELRAASVNFGGDLLVTWLDFVQDTVPAALAPLLSAAQTKLPNEGWELFANSILADLEDLYRALDDHDSRKADFEDERHHLKQCIREAHGKPLAEFLRGFSLQSKTPDPKPGDVCCATISASKGAEWDYVYLAGLADGVLPSYYAVKAGEGSPQMEEERRLCFVAITRTRGILTLSWAKSYSGYQKLPSVFLSEMSSNP